MLHNKCFKEFFSIVETVFHNVLCYHWQAGRRVVSGQGKAESYTRHLHTQGCQAAMCLSQSSSSCTPLCSCAVTMGTAATRPRQLSVQTQTRLSHGSSVGECARSLLSHFAQACHSPSPGAWRSTETTSSELAPVVHIPGLWGQ